MLFVVAGCGGTTPDPCGGFTGATGHDLVMPFAADCSDALLLGVRVAGGDPGAPTWDDGKGALRLGGAWKSGAGGMWREVTITNGGSTPATLVGIEWSTPKGGLHVAGATGFLHNGYQSWSYSGMERLSATAPADVNGTAAHGGDDEDITGERSGVSWWWTALADATNHGLVAGAGGGTVLKTYFAADVADGLRLRIVEGVTGEAITLAPGETRTLDPIYLAFGDVPTLLDAYAAWVATLHPPAANRAPLGGWGSWNFYYDMPTAQAMRDEAAYAQATLVPLGLTDFLLDDGYEPHWGQWEASMRFGADLATLNQEQVAAKLRPAVWLAPFYLAVDDPLVTQHADWFVHKKDGTLKTYDNIGPIYAAFDVTSDGAQKYVTDAVKRLHDWGYKTLKIDFLFGGATTGVRKKAITGLEAYQMWMKALHEAAPDLHLVGCGAPILPSVGWVGSMRVGADIAFINQPEPRYPYMAGAARQTIFRSITDHFWALDPDVLLLRGDKLKDPEAWTAVVSAALAGGNYLLGDGRQASALRQAMALDPEIRALIRDGRAARAEDLTANTDERIYLSPILDISGSTAVPHRWRKDSADGKTHWLAVFAWDGDYGEATALPSGAREIVPPATGMAPATLVAAPAAPFSVASHGARLFKWTN